MIIDMRTYTHKPSRYREFLRIYQESGYAITSRHLGFNVGLFTTSSDTVNRTVQWFAYEDHDHRDACRNGYLSSAVKQAFTNGDEGADGCIRTQESRVLIPTAFSPLRDRDPGNPVLRAEGCPRRMFEFNTYYCLPGQLAGALDAVEHGLYPAAQKHAEWIIAYLTGDAGPERIYELRAYSSLQRRMEANAAMRADGEYSAAWADLCRHLRDTDSVIWEPMPMSAIQ